MIIVGAFPAEDREHSVEYLSRPNCAEVYGFMRSPVDERGSN
jgi:hypothetical protein